MTSVGSLRRDNRGVAYVEFLIAFVPVFMLCMGVVQYGLLATAQLVVGHAAVAGVRSAVVVLDDDPAHYDEPVGVLNPDDSADLAGWEQAMLDRLGMGPLEPNGRSARRGGSRLSAIRRAVSVPLSVLAPDGAEFLARASGDADGPLSRTFGGGNITRLGVGLGVYNDWAAAVTLPHGPGAGGLYTDAVPADATSITLRVTYLYRCTVPVVSALMCDAIEPPALPKLAKPGDAKARRELLGELEHVPSPLGLAALLAGGGRFLVLRAEATLPRQNADYAYAVAD